jgi:hypothetical protein
MLQTTQTVLSCPDNLTNKKAMLPETNTLAIFPVHDQQRKKSFHMIKTRA